MKIRTHPILELSVSRLARMEGVIDFNPPYQREGGVWKEETRARLVDSVINSIDLPKIYLEEATGSRKGSTGLTVQYAVLDGKQRLESLLAFLANDLPLPTDFLFFEDLTVRAAGYRIEQLRQEYPGLVRRLLDYELPMVRVVADSGDLVEEMFQRLNASTSLNAAERRNALTGPTRDAANALAMHSLLLDCSPIRSERYKYRELGAKFLAIEQQMTQNGRLVDTKADTLYALFTATRGGAKATISPGVMQGYERAARSILDRMYPVFELEDRLLASIGTVVVYYIAFRRIEDSDLITRAKLENFERLRRQAARMSEAADDYARGANARLREYNVFVQSTNDGKALTRRASVLQTFLHAENETEGLDLLDRLEDGELPATEEDAIT